MGWAPAQWITLLAPYLTGTPEAAYCAFPNEEAHDYRAMKVAILDTLHINPETF